MDSKVVMCLANFLLYMEITKIVYEGVLFKASFERSLLVGCGLRRSCDAGPNWMGCIVA